MFDKTQKSLSNTEVHTKEKNCKSIIKLDYDCLSSSILHRKYPSQFHSVRHAYSHGVQMSGLAFGQHLGPEVCSFSKKKNQGKVIRVISLSEFSQDIENKSCIAIIVKSVVMELKLPRLTTVIMYS